MSDEKPKFTPLATGCLSQEIWDIAVEKTEPMGNWLDLFFGWIPGVKYHLWNTRAIAFALGYQVAKGLE